MRDVPDTPRHMCNISNEQASIVLLLALQANTSSTACGAACENGRIVDAEEGLVTSTFHQAFTVSLRLGLKIHVAISRIVLLKDVRSGFKDCYIVPNSQIRAG